MNSKVENPAKYNRIDNHKDLLRPALGKDFGLTLTDLEVPVEAAGIGENISFVPRYSDYEIDGHLIKKVLAARILDEYCDDVISGSEIVFDPLDIEFEQADEIINFTCRGAELNS